MEIEFRKINKIVFSLEGSNFKGMLTRCTEIMDRACFKQRYTFSLKSVCLFLQKTIMEKCRNEHCIEME